MCSKLRIVTMKFFIVFLALPLLGLCQQQFRQPPNCFGSEESLLKPMKCVSTQQLCGGGNYANNTCTCKPGYVRAGQTGKVCIPSCTGTTQTCGTAGVGGNCTATNFCSCGPGLTFVNGQCQNSANDACGG